MSPSKIVVHSSLAEAGIFFDADQPVAAAPQFSQFATVLGQELGANYLGEVANEAGQSEGWAAHKAQLRVGNDLVKLEWARGSIHTLMVQVEGETAAATRALPELWKLLSSMAGVAPKPLEELGAVFVGTTAVVELPKSFEDLFPNGKFLRDATLQHFNDGPFKSIGDPQFRFSIDLQATLGRRVVKRVITVEPRHSARPGQRIFWTQSPLSTSDHLKMLEQLCEQARS